MGQRAIGTHASVSVLLPAAFLIVTAASATQTMIGFGGGLLAIPLLAVVADARTAVVAMCLISLAQTGLIAVRDRAAVHWRTVALLLVAAIITMPVGLLVLLWAPDRLLTGLIAVVVLACTYLVWRPPRLPAGRGPLVAVGGLTGILATSTGTNGPPLVAAFRALGYGPRAFRATLSAVFLGTGSASAIAFVLAGAVTQRAALVTLVGLPAAVVGWLVADRFFARLDADSFGRLILVALVICSLLALGRALTG